MPDVSIKLPEGMDKSQFGKLFDTFLKQRVSTQARDKAVRAATKDVVNAHKPEYEAALAKYMPAE